MTETKPSQEAGKTLKKKVKKTSKKNKVGRPPIWKDPIDLKELVFDYFKDNERPTLAGLARSLRIDRQTLYNYEKKDEFFDIVKDARERVEETYEDRLVYGNKPTGVIFALKNMGWADRRETDITTLGKELPTPIYGSQSTKSTKKV